MTIGIITLQLHRNYGGILQNYALQQVLRRQGHNPITIDKRPARNNVRFVLSYLKWLTYKLLKIKTPEIFYFEHTTRGDKFSHFVNNHIDISESVSSYTQRIVTSNHLDLIIVGSDQVWRRAFFTKEDIKNYFGAFLKTEKIPIVSYAVSFGVDKWDYEEDLTAECALLASKFIGISTREDSGVTLCKNLGIDNAVAVLDPTLMLNAEDYCKVCNNVPAHDNNFLFAYLLDCSQVNVNLVKSIAKKKGLTPVIVQSEFHAQISMEEWLSYFRDCKYVVTDSFHGTAFSILFRKEFNTIINTLRGGDRFYSLLNRFGLLERIISSHEKTCTDAIEWDCVFEKLNNWRTISMSYLTCALTQCAKA